MSEDRFTADIARELSYAKQDIFDRTLRVIRNIADSKMRDAARVGKTSIDFEVPRSVFGRPPYETANMGRKLAEQLHADGFRVSGTHVRFSISWGRCVQEQQPETVIQVPVPKIRPKKYN